MRRGKALDFGGDATPARKASSTKLYRATAQLGQLRRFRDSHAPNVFCEILLARTRLRCALLIVRKTAGVLVRVMWLAICANALVNAYKGHQGSSDWKLEEGLAFEMMVLSFPASFLVVAALILVGAGLGFFSLTL